MEWKGLIGHMKREGLQNERVAAITEAPKFLFESGPDDKAAARRVHAAAEKLISAGNFRLPAPQVLIEDPVHGGERGWQFYLCTQRTDDIEVWGASKLLGRFFLYGTPKSIPLRTGASWMDDVNSPTIAVKEFVLAMNDPMAAKIGKGDYTHVGWIKGQMPTTKPGDFEGFINALSRGEVHVLNSENGTKETLIEHDPNRWSVPVYDFGPLLNGKGDGALDRDLLMRLLEEAPHGALRAASSVFLFRDSSDPIRGSFTTLVRVDGLRNGKPNVTFTCAHVQRHLRHADMTLHPGYWSVLTPSDEVAECEVLADIACRLLAAWHDNFEVREARNYRMAKINKKRLAANQAPIQVTRTIHISDARIVYLREGLAARAVAATGRMMPQHKRTITDRWIYPKSPGTRQFRPYQRTPKNIIVNQGRAPVAAQFRVVE
jgi:hypothetical protein